MILASVTACSELKLDPDEAERLAKAAAKVIEYYELHRVVGIATHPLAGLARVSWALYMPRLMAIRMRQMAEAAKDVTPPRASSPQPPPAAPQAPQAQTPPASAGARVPITSPPGVIRANPIPGYEHVTIDVPLPGKPN